MQRPWKALTLTIPLLLLSEALPAQDTLQQDPIAVTGNRGLPKTLFIAPWKRLGAPLEPGALSGTLDRPAAVEREVLRRELDLYREGFNID